MSNHLGNVLTVINDIKVPQSSNSVDVDGYLATIVSTADYSPFGAQLDGRTVSAETYRFGFNGMEKESDWSGEGNMYTTEFRMLDPRLGRWLSLDPLMSDFPYTSPYVAFANNPVFFIDPYGLSPTNGDHENCSTSSESASSESTPDLLEPIILPIEVLNNQIKLFAALHNDIEQRTREI